MRAAVALLAGALTTLAIPQAPPSPAPQLAAEIDRARALLEAAAPEAERANPIVRLDRAKAALGRGQVYLATYLTEAGWEAAKNWEFVKASSDVTTSDAFVKKWTSMGEPRPTPAGSTAIPAVVEALAAVAEARGPTTYHAAKPYAEDSGLFGGLYYLSDAHAVMQFARTIRSWDWPAPGAAPSFRSIAAEISTFDTEMTTAYEKMDRANHSTYIVASAALKQARTLNERGKFSGAVLEYLLARYLFAPLRGPAGAEASATGIADARKSFTQTSDHSVVELFLQLADESLAGGSDAQRRAAAAVLEDVVPAYRAAIAAPSTTTSAAAASAVTITLVRWPFT